MVALGCLAAQQGRMAFFCCHRHAALFSSLFPSNVFDTRSRSTDDDGTTRPISHHEQQFQFQHPSRRRRHFFFLHSFRFSTWSNSYNDDGDNDNIDDKDADTSPNQRHHRPRIVITPGGTSSNTKKNEMKKKQRQQQQQPQDRPFLDRIQLQTRGGSGGSGCISYHRIGSYKKRPCGGHGGLGGNVYLVVDPTVTSLTLPKRHYFGQDGSRGGVNGRNGKSGRHVYVRVPQGVIVRRVLEFEEMKERRSMMVVVGGDEEEEGSVLDKRGGTHEEEREVNDHDSDGEYEDDDEENQYFEVNTHELEEDNVDHDSDDDPGDDDYDGDNFEKDDDIDQTINTQQVEEEEDFDTQYERMLSSKRSRRRVDVAGRSNTTPSDYDDVVNQGVRAEDGMFYWSSPDTNDDERQTMMASMDEDYPSRKTVFLADLDQPHSTLLVAQGGKAGVGNQAYANRPYFSNMEVNAAKKAIPGTGECTYLELELKLIADVGLVGFPNAGKSSLLSAMSRAKPKIASYPFTTLHPLVGSIQYRDGCQIVVADVPGLIEGAAEGRGRGIEFLRHIERTKALVYMVDGAGVDGRDPVSDLRVLGNELREYGSSGIFGKNEIDGEGEYEEEMRKRRREIMNRPSIILANKMDLIPEDDANMGRREEILFQLSRAAEDVGIVCDRTDILGVSAGVTGEGLRVLSKTLRRTVLGL